MAEKQMNVIVKKTAKKKPTWIVNIVWHDGSPGHFTVGLPGEFTMTWANTIARTLAWAYQACGYTVALKTAIRGRG